MFGQGPEARSIPFLIPIWITIIILALLSYNVYIKLSNMVPSLPTYYIYIALGAPLMLFFCLASVSTFLNFKSR